MLSQQMRSGNCEFEDGDRQLSLIPSNSVGNYNNQQQQSISNECSTVDSSLIPDTYSLSTESYCGHDDTVLNLIVDSSFNDHFLSPKSLCDRSLTQIYFGFDYFSQSTACIATRFGECSSTLLDKLWYLYLYIYSTTTIILLLFIVAILMPPTT